MDITRINNHKDLFLDINKFDEDNMSYIKPILFYKVVRNMGIYYKKDIGTKNKPIIKKQKIIVQSPKMVAPFGVKEFKNKDRKSYQMALSFSTLTNLYNEEEIKKFYYFIKRIDTVNEETIMDYKKEWGLPKKMTYKKTLQRLSKDYPHHMNINLPYDEKTGFLFNVYNETAEKSGIDIIEKKSIVSVVMELTDIRFNDTEFRTNWTVLQIRKFKPYSPIQDFFMSGCYILDEDNPDDRAFELMIDNYRKKLSAPIMSQIALQIAPQIAPLPYYAQTNPMQQQKYSTVPPTPPPNKNIIASTFKPPTLAELLDAKKTLKKTTTVEKNKESGKVLEDKPLRPAPKKTKKSTSKKISATD